MTVTTQEPQPTAQQPASRRRWLYIAVAAAVLVAAGAALAIMLTRDADHVVNESAWRQAREAQGTTFTNWRQYADTFVDDVCTDDDFGIFVAGRLDDGATEEQVRTDFTYACPDRLPDFERELQSIADPCAGMDAAARDRMEEAVGGGFTC